MVCLFITCLPVPECKPTRQRPGLSCPTLHLQLPAQGLAHRAGTQIIVDAWVDGWMDGWKGGWVGGWMDEWMEGYLPLSSISSVPPFTLAACLSLENLSPFPAEVRYDYSQASDFPL